MFKGKIKFNITKKHVVLYLIELFLSGLYVAFDLLTKHFIFMPIDSGAKVSDDFIHIDGVIRFVAVHNTGSSFGMFRDNNTALAIFSCVLIAGIAVFLFFVASNKSKLFKASIILILAGGIGNLVDRFAFGYVRDFVYFELIDFAVFNFADSALVIGTVLLIIFVVFFYRPDDSKKKKPEKIAEESADNAAVSSDND